MTRRLAATLGAVALLLTASCAERERDPDAQQEQSANEAEKKAAQEAWQRHPMGQCLAERGFPTEPVVTTKDDHERVSGSPYLFGGPIVSVAKAEPYSAYTAVWLGGDRFEQHVASKDTPSNRSVSIEPLQRLGCDPETHKIVVVWDEGT